MKHNCDNHHIKMIKESYWNIHCKECDKYLKHASYAELDAWDKMTEEERKIVTYGQLYNICYQQIVVYDKNDPIAYVKSFSEDTVWLDIPYDEKDEAKKLKAGLHWEPNLKVWHTNINYKNVMKLNKWFFPADRERVAHYHNIKETV
jgi:hypothetical protein